MVGGLRSTMTGDREEALEDGGLQAPLLFVPDSEVQHGPTEPRLGTADNLGGFGFRSVAEVNIKSFA